MRKLRKIVHWWQNPSRISNSLSLVDPVGLTFISLLPTLRQVPCPGFLDTGPAISLLTALVLSPVRFDILTTWPSVGFINSIFPNTWKIQEPMPFSPPWPSLAVIRMNIYYTHIGAPLSLMLFCGVFGIHSLGYLLHGSPGKRMS